MFKNPNWSMIENFVESQFIATDTVFCLIAYSNSRDICGNEYLYSFPLSLHTNKAESLASHAEI